MGGGGVNSVLKVIGFVRDSMAMTKTIQLCIKIRLTRNWEILSQILIQSIINKSYTKY